MSAAPIEAGILDSTASKTSYEIIFQNNNDYLFNNLSVKEISLTESLMTPGLQTSITFHNFLHTPVVKILDNFKSAVVNINLKKPLLSAFGFDPELSVYSRIYRLSDRTLVNNNVEQFTLHGCDDTLLHDARNLVSKSWKCVTPSSIVSEVLQSCAGAKSMDIESSGPARDYIAENIHPFQVISQQADVALAGDDPSFVHYMTYEGFQSGNPVGTHHFRSLRSLTADNSGVARFFTQETGVNSGFSHPESIITHNFLCDFDYLSDILNGLDLEKGNLSSLVTINPMLKQFSLLGNKAGFAAAGSCGVGGGQYMAAFSNFNSAGEQDSCNSDVEKHLLLRQARMSLLEQDKLALRLTVPFNPVLHAGKMIEAYFINKSSEKYENYGTGLYLIHSVTHNVKTGGYGVTTMDCVSQSVGGGIQ